MSWNQGHEGSESMFFPCNILQWSVSRKGQTVARGLAYVVQEPAVPLENA